MGTRLFTNKKLSEVELSKKHTSTRRQIKYWEQAKEFTATHTVIGDYVLFVVTAKRPHYMIETHDAVMAENLRQMFKGMWDEVQ
jgi:hypothetical protein